MRRVCSLFLAIKPDFIGRLSIFMALLLPFATYLYIFLLQTEKSWVVFEEIFTLNFDITPISRLQLVPDLKKLFLKIPLKYLTLN